MERMFSIKECMKDIANITDEFKDCFEVDLNKFRKQKFDTPDEMWKAVIDEVDLCKEEHFFEETEFEKLIDNYYMFEKDIYIWAYYLLMEEIDNIGFCSNYYRFFYRNIGRSLMKTDTMFYTEDMFREIEQEKTEEGIIKKYGFVRNKRIEKWSYCRIRSIEERKDFTIVDRIRFYYDTDCNLARMLLENYRKRRGYNYNDDIWKMLTRDEVFVTAIWKQNDNFEIEEKGTIECSDAGRAFFILVNEISHICRVYPFVWRYHYYYNYMEEEKRFSKEEYEENRTILERYIEINEKFRILLRGYIYCIYNYKNWKEYVQSDLRDKAEEALDDVTFIYKETDEKMMKDCSNTSIRMWSRKSEEQKLYAVIQAAVILAIAQNREG